MSEKKIIKNYLKTQCLKIIPDEATLDKIINIKNILIKVKKNNSRVFIFGNGGSAAIASHASVDLGGWTPGTGSCSCATSKIR